MGAGRGAGQGQGSAGGPLSQGEDKRGLRSWSPQIGNLDVYVGSTAKPSSNRLRRSQALWEHRGNTGKAQSGGAPLNRSLEELGLKLGVQAFYQLGEVVMMTIARLPAVLPEPTTHPHLVRSQILAVWIC